LTRAASSLSCSDNDFTTVPFPFSASFAARGDKGQEH
jgi:hypothetical protein